ncbi:MAG: DMT family transporter [Deltaproteobacteria bacterium]|nr:DMT family transporter [Deltaproteobacteria bacterium]
MLGEVAALGAAFSWAGSSYCYERFGRSATPVALTAFKNALGAGLFLLGCLLTKTIWPSSSRSSMLIASAGLLGFGLGDPLFFFSMKHLGVQLACTLQCTAPFIAALLARGILRESLSFLQFVGMGIAGVAVWLSIRNPTTVASPVSATTGASGGQHASAKRWWAVLWGLAAATCYAGSTVLLRAHVGQTSAVAVNLLQLLPPLIALGILMHIRRRRDPASPGWEFLRDSNQASGLSTAVVLGTVIGLFLQSESLRLTSAAVSSALGNTYPLWLSLAVSWKSASRRQLRYSALAVVGVILLTLGRSPIH